MEIPQEILNGIELLDQPRTLKLLSELREEEVTDWRLLIDKNKLNMETCSTCILGQLFGKYWYGLAALGLLEVPEGMSVIEAYLDDENVTGMGEEFGFNLEEDNEDWEKLTNQWKQVLSEKEQQS